MLAELPVAALDVDADARIVGANHLACDLLGGDPAGHELGSVVDGFTGWLPSAALRSVSRIPENEVTLRRLDGSTFHGSVSAAYRRDGDGTMTGALVVLRPSIPRGRHAPSGIEVVSTVSHELRSPLTSVKGYTSLLLNRWDRIDEDQKKVMLSQVHHDADRVTRLVTELLDISRLETGRLHLRRQMVDVVTLAKSVVQKVALEYDGIECAVEFPDDFPEVYADPDKLEQVLTNLVENAAKYASPTGMRIVGSVDGNDIILSVHDVGEGIPASDLPKVFTKFFRRDHGKPTGSGLGLWISRGLVEAHGGELTATSIEGIGSTFTFTLPADAFEKLHDVNA